MFLFVPTVKDPFIKFESDKLSHLPNLRNFPSGLKEVPEDIPDDTILLDLQNNKIAEIKENDFKNLKGLQVSHFLLLHVLLVMSWVM